MRFIMKNKLKKFSRNIKDNLLEYYLIFLIVVGLPAAVYFLTSLVWAFAIFITVQIVIGVLALRRG